SQSEVELTEAVSRGQFVHARGEDAQAGQVLLPRGTVLGLPEAALLWGQALAYAPVPRRPRVAVLAAGDELCAVDAPLPDRLIDVNTPALCEAVRRAGGEPRALGIAADALPDLGAALARATDVDVVVTAGGASVGDRDLLREALSRHGVVLDFWRVAIKPGKPLAVGRRGRTLFFALPGNPVSALVTFELFVRPALRRMSGHAEVSPLTIPAVAAAPMRKPAGLRHYLRVTAAWRDGALWATPLGSQNSGAVRSAAGPPTSASFPKRSPLGRWATR
ncbi:MAG TPA: molybdopterin molybdotransferase MoeA, partial [Myxococcaceae bacterium]|nr:molybdopterin molybdotransferase MoeA [Myxococcaceae bacterium]